MPPNIRLAENIPNWTYYPQLGISNPQLGTSNPQLMIIGPIGDWGFLSQVKQNRGLTEENTQLVIISPIEYFNLPIGDWWFVL